MAEKVKDIGSFGNFLFTRSLTLQHTLSQGLSLLLDLRSMNMWTCAKC